MSDRDEWKQPGGIQVHRVILVCLAVVFIVGGATSAVLLWPGGNESNETTVITTEIQDEEAEGTSEPETVADSESAVSGSSSSEQSVPVDNDSAVKSTGTTHSDGYCLLTMVGEGNNYSEEPDPYSTALLSADVCLDLYDLILFFERTNHYHPDEIVLPEALTE